MKKSLEDLDALVESPVIATLSGFQHLGEMQQGNIDNITMMLVGVTDYQLRCAFYFSEKNKSYPVYVRDLMIPVVTEALERLRTHYQRKLKFAMDEEAREEEALAKTHQQKQFSKAAEQFKSMSVPAPEGTVDELSKKYGVSKSHVRLLKREGRLNELAESNG